MSDYCRTIPALRRVKSLTFRADGTVVTELWPEPEPYPVRPNCPDCGGSGIVYGQGGYSDPLPCYEYGACAPEVRP